MKDVELEILEHWANWRWCQIRNGNKAPVGGGWQRNPLTLDQVNTDGVGVLLGPASGGVVAIDFDGSSSMDFFERRFDRNVVNFLTGSVSWSSGSFGRAQVAYRVPEVYWDHLAQKSVTTHVYDAAEFDHPDHAPKAEQLEFRWAGHQSVLPPIIHPSGRPYAWIEHPSRVFINNPDGLPQLPDPVLAYWLLLCNPEPQAIKPKSAQQYPKLSPEEVEDILRQYVATLGGAIPDRNEWMEISFAIFNSVDWPQARTMLERHLPPTGAADEYVAMYKSWDPARSHRIGTVIHYIQQRGTYINPRQRDPWASNRRSQETIDFFK